jgi:coniferyl-aldehyde dehydrogenase
MTSEFTSKTELIDPSNEVQRAYERLRHACEYTRYPAYETRIRWLRSLQQLVEENEDRIVSSISGDFGHRSRYEIEATEIFVSMAEIKQALRHLKGWMRPERVRTPIYLLPGSAWIERQPVGVVGIISPWNYPLSLAISPASAALAAGNRVLLKPSELTPRFAELLKELVARYFVEDEVAVVTGTREVGESVCHLPLNHLFFTGSTAVGREVAKMVSENLTPVTLELGGKSPVIIGANVDLAKAARCVAFGKMINSGQTCIAPDYCLVPRAQLHIFASQLASAAATMFPDSGMNPDYTSIISDRHLDRLQTHVNEARQAGSKIVTLGAAVQQTRRMPLQIVVDPPMDSAVMREEIFGPVLPVLPYETFEGVIALINAGPRPLALYFFGDDPGQQRRISQEIVAGGVTINDTLWHFAHPHLPFGGSGASGMGAYHGAYGFRLFSHEKGVFKQSKWSPVSLLYAPYGKTAHRMLRLLRRLA